MQSDLIISSLSVAVIISIVFSLHGIIQQQIRNLQERLEAEAIRLKENTEKAEKRLDDLSYKAEQRLREETANVELRRQETARFLEEKQNIRFAELWKHLDQINSSGGDYEGVP